MRTSDSEGTWKIQPSFQGVKLLIIFFFTRKTELMSRSSNIAAPASRPCGATGRWEYLLVAVLMQTYMSPWWGLGPGVWRGWWYGEGHLLDHLDQVPIQVNVYHAQEKEVGLCRFFLQLLTNFLFSSLKYIDFVSLYIEEEKCCYAPLLLCNAQATPWMLKGCWLNTFGVRPYCINETNKKLIIGHFLQPSFSTWTGLQLSL